MKMKELWIQSILAGLCIGIGGSFFLAIDNKIVGALMFTFGLTAICTRGFHLYTGRVGYILDNKPSYAATLIITWLGNLLGTNLVAYSLLATRQGAAFQAKAMTMCDAKLSDGPISIFILAIFCNILMYLAVDGFKNNPHEIGKYIFLFLCVAGFILAGFEHCIANMFYFGVANVWNMHTIVWLIIMSLGNLCGGLLIPLCKKILS